MIDQPIRPEVVNALAARPQWSKRDARIGERSGYQCAYCDLDFYASPRNYKQWSKDHIVPLCRGGKDEEPNIVAACDTCNKYKGTWDPREVAGPDATRDKLIDVARSYLRSKFQKFDDEQLARERGIVGWGIFQSGRCR
jgi:5-methylcytosine-specific restriction endonuclease McrA